MIFSAGVLSTALALGACGGSQARTDGDTASVSSEAVVATGATMRVDGLGCPMCAESIAILMDKVDGVTGSRVDLGTGTVHVDLDGETPVSAQQLRRAIDDGGFTFRSIEFEG
jgi:copper chaperone CopZ